MQGFIVLAIRDTAGMSPLPDDLAAEWLRAYRCGFPMPEERLDGFLNLYKKIKRKNIAALVQGTPFRPSGTQGRSVKLLNRLRNQFVHFLPASWSLEAKGLPHICLDCLAVIQYLAYNYRDRYFLWREETYLHRSDAAIGAADALLKELTHEYEGKVY